MRYVPEVDDQMQPSETQTIPLYNDALRTDRRAACSVPRASSWLGPRILSTVNCRSFPARVSQVI
jgi:hypothetical protein